MHAALESPAGRASPDRAARVGSAPGSPLVASAATCAAVAALLTIVGLSVADGLLASTVAYERDTTVFYFPLMSWAAQQLRQGIFPLWTPQVFGGYPIFADGEIGLSYPPALLALLTLPADRAFVLLRLVHLWLAAVGTFALVRAWGLPRTSAVLAGVIFALGSFLQAQIHHENIVRTAAWLPLVLALAERALCSSELRRRIRWTIVACVALGLAGLSLHSQMLAIDLLVFGMYGVMRLLVGPLADARTQWRSRLLLVAQVCVPIVILGLSMAAVQLVPLLELAGFSPRGSGIPYSDSAAYSLTVPGLAQLVWPFLFRGPGGLQWGLWTHWESYIYIGLAPLVLALLALLRVRCREVAAWGVIAGLGIVLALGQYSPINLHYFLWLLPGLSGLRAPGRFAIVVVLAGAMLAAYGLAWLSRDGRATVRPNRPAVSAVLAIGAVCVLLVAAVLVLHVALLTWPDAARNWIQANYLALPRDTYPLSNSDVYDGLVWATDLGHNPRAFGSVVGLAVVLAGLLAWQLPGRPAVRRWPGWPTLLIAGTALDLLVFSWGIHPRAPLAELGAEPDAVQAVEQMHSNDSLPPRLLASPVLNQVTADRLAPFGVQEANGYSSLQFIWHRDYLGRVLYVDDALLDLWGVQYVVDPARYGFVSSYRGVNFLTQQALMHGPAGSAISETTFALQPGTTVREVRLVTAMMGAVDVPQDTPVAELELRDASGALADQRVLLAGRDSMEWAAELPAVQSHLAHQEVESSGVAFEGSSEPRQRKLSFADLVFDSPVGAQSLTLRVVQPKGELAVYGGAVIGSEGEVQQLFGRTKSKYRQVYADSEMRVFENRAALPRAFLVGTAHTAPSVGSALNEMVHQPFDPRSEVVLAADSGASLGPSKPAGSSAPGDVQIVSYSANAVRLHARATQDAFLVLTDTFYPGWVARVDGHTQPIMRGDVLFRVMAITAGDHDIELSFEPISVRLGLIVSGAALLLALAAWLGAGNVHRRGRTTK